MVSQSRSEVAEIIQDPDATEIALQAANAVARPLAAAEIAQAQSQAAADQSDLAEINMLERGRGLVDGANQANTLLAQAVADRQNRLKVADDNKRLIEDIINDYMASEVVPNTDFQGGDQRMYESGLRNMITPPMGL